MGFMKNLKQLGRMTKRKKNKGNKQDPSTYQTFTDASGKDYKMDRATHAFHTMMKNKGTRTGGSGLNFFRGPRGLSKINPQQMLTAMRTPGWNASMGGGFSTGAKRGYTMRGWPHNTNIT